MQGRGRAANSDFRRQPAPSGGYGGGRFDGPPRMGGYAPAPAASYGGYGAPTGGPAAQSWW